MQFALMGFITTLYHSESEEILDFSDTFIYTPMLLYGIGKFNLDSRDSASSAPRREVKSIIAVI